MLIPLKAYRLTNQRFLNLICRPFMGEVGVMLRHVKYPNGGQQKLMIESLCHVEQNREPNGVGLGHLRQVKYG